MPNFDTSVPTLGENAGTKYSRTISTATDSIRI